ncbi:MAG: xanthine dehydrogenase family protein molybdopterin-binding subunit, partial [Planctomycetes bacterium]|nr:xanthine dehydrogenase family protein molybdopterin-binding subunit [Planctomycetota bacterium]
MPGFAVVGQSVPRIDGREKVTGAATYAADVQLPGLLWGRILRSSEPHARLARVDASRARQLPGVRAVITGADLGGLRTGVVLQDMPVLCDDRVRFVGDAIAAVAADDPDVAEEALSLVEVEYEPLPAVFNPRQALTTSAPLVHPAVTSYAGRPELPDVPNLQSISRIQKGDLEQGFAEADLVLEHTFSTSLVHQGYLESRACTLQLADDGSVHVWSSCQTPYRLRDLLAELLQLPNERVVVERVSVGGSFGAKGGVGPEPIAYFLAKATGRPVRIVPTSTEELLTGNPRHPATITLKTGVRRDGTLLARQATMVMDGGAYAAHMIMPTLVLPSVARTLGPYRIPHTSIECRWAYTNSDPCGIARAPGQPQVVFAGESQMDVIADALGLDPIDFRLRNAMVDGETWPDGGKLQDIMVKPTLALVRRASGWDAPLGPNRGRGVAVTERGIASGPCGLVLTLHDDGRVTALSAVPDVGTGAFTILKAVLAEQLQVPFEMVKVVTGDTATALYDAGIGGSKTTFSSNHSATAATTELKRRLTEAAADRLECS